ncbi:GLABRA2 expression modulator-like [Impatiens glandulifera]|uniref:GLABRA2 expression modulator-like n=1 Tax=Impatiens glandulifera TaxID=253017 RepID=UPI001FB08D26|nr:GLABRA2 expression modulator-like [Impatiens glandulifera]
MAGKTILENPSHGVDPKKLDPEPPTSTGGAGHESASDQSIRTGEIDQQTTDTDNQLKKLKLASSNNLSRSKRTVRWNKELVTESPRVIAARLAASNNAAGYVPEPSSSPAPPASYTESFISRISSVRIALLRWGNNVKEATKKAEDLAGNTWQHLKTSPSVTDAALGRIAQGAKVLAEGGYDKIFRQTFETSPDEDLQNSFVCYLSTSAGPVMGVLYLSTSKLAYCSDTPMPFKSSTDLDNTNTNTQWSYYKVIIPLEQLKSVHPSSNGSNRAEKYIQVLSTDNHEFWYMGFVNYEAAVHNLESALCARDMSV